MKIEEIPADTMVNMTDFWQRAFSANGCNPCCHSCGNWIKTGDSFQLTTKKSTTKYNKREDGRVSNMRTYVGNGEVESVEIMICSSCDPDDFERRQYEDAELFKMRQNQEQGGCYRVNGKIIH